jgi:hypothetical protein
VSGAGLGAALYKYNHKFELEEETINQTYFENRDLELIGLYSRLLNGAETRCITLKLKLLAKAMLLQHFRATLKSLMRPV